MLKQVGSSELETKVSGQETTSFSRRSLRPPLEQVFLEGGELLSFFVVKLFISSESTDSLKIKKNCFCVLLKAD